MYDTLQLLIEAIKSNKYGHQSIVSDDSSLEILLAQANKIADVIAVKCAPYLKQWNRKQMLYRGVGTPLPYGQFASIVNVRTNRRPTGSSKTHHTHLNKMFSGAGLKANRSNSLFCSGDKSQADMYGTPLVVFPVGEFNYTWSPNVTDAIEMEDDSEGISVSKVEMERIKSAMNVLTRNKKAKDPENWMWKRKPKADELQLTSEAKAIITTLLKNPKAYKLFVKKMKEIKTELKDCHELILTNKELTALAATAAGWDISDRISYAYKSKGKTHLSVYDDQISYHIVQSLTDAPTHSAEGHGYRGDDGSLNNAIQSNCEVMVKCDQTIYVSPGMAKLVLMKLSGNTITKQDVQRVRADL